jgi:hypothetical protein
MIAVAVAESGGEVRSPEIRAVIEALQSKGPLDPEQPATPSCVSCQYRT